MKTVFLISVTFMCQRKQSGRGFVLCQFSVNISFYSILVN